MTNQKTNCRECAVEILVSTAESTGGLCMPCKSGKRKNINEALLQREERKKHDPWREYWTSLVTRAFATVDGWKQFSSEEQLYYAVSVLNGEVYNGGMYQFFSNSSGAMYREALSGLEILGAKKSKQLLLEAADLLFDGTEPPADRRTRWDSMKRLPESEDVERTPDWCRQLQAIDEAYWKDPDGLYSRLTEFAERHGLIQPFLHADT